jgi:hypothetical protein
MVLFATAKEHQMPKDVLDFGEMERINISLFLKHSSSIFISCFNIKEPFSA